MIIICEKKKIGNKVERKNCKSIQISQKRFKIIDTEKN